MPPSQRLTLTEAHSSSHSHSHPSSQSQPPPPLSHHYHSLTISPTRMVIAPLKHSFSPTLTASLSLSHSSSMRFHAHPAVDAKPTFLPLWSVTAHCKIVRVKFPGFTKPTSTSLSSFPKIFFLGVNFLILTWFLLLGWVVLCLVW